MIYWHGNAHLTTLVHLITVLMLVCQNKCWNVEFLLMLDHHSIHFCKFSRWPRTDKKTDASSENKKEKGREAAFTRLRHWIENRCSVYASLQYLHLHFATCNITSVVFFVFFVICICSSPHMLIRMCKLMCECKCFCGNKFVCRFLLLARANRILYSCINFRVHI